MNFINTIETVCDKFIYTDYQLLHQVGGQTQQR